MNCNNSCVLPGTCNNTTTNTNNNSNTNYSTWPTDRASCTSQSKIWCDGTNGSSGWCQMSAQLVLLQLILITTIIIGQQIKQVVPHKGNYGAMELMVAVVHVKWLALLAHHLIIQITIQALGPMTKLVVRTK